MRGESIQSLQGSTSLCQVFSMFSRKCFTSNVLRLIKITATGVQQEFFYAQAGRSAIP